ncbi:MAG: PLP-dependent aminotransferase family protein [Oscillospiraceae bacterium]|nr:PLP-dependent aminotransferase family protein [Oscillospiraceae bacterium]
MGSKLPSKRILAEEMGLSVVTVQHAYSLLGDEGYIESRQRSGYFIIYQKSDFMSPGKDAALCAAPPIHNLAASATGFPFSVVAKTMRKVLSDYGPSIFERSHNKGCLRLREVICTYLKRSVGITADPRQVIIGAGAEYLYSLVVQLLGKDKIYALEKPSYQKIQQVYKAHGVRCELLDLGANGIKTSLLKATNAAVLHITPFNSYPSHITASAPKRQEYLRWAAERHGFLVEDNYDSELTISKTNEDTVFSLDNSGRVLYINTFSQTISPSVRVGYMVLPPSMVPRYEERLGFYSCTVPVFDQYVLAELISSGDFERHINRVRRKKRKQFRNLDT